MNSVFLNDEILSDIFLHLDDFSKVNLLNASLGTIWNNRLQKSLKLEPIELHFGKVEKVNKKNEFYPPNRNFMLMKLMNIKFNLNFYYDDINASNLLKVMDFVKFNNIKHKIHLLNLRSNQISKNAFLKFYEIYNNSLSLITGVNLYGDKSNIPWSHLRLKNLTDIKLARYDLAAGAKFPFYESKLEKMELIDCYVTYLPKYLTHLKIQRCVFTIPAIFPLTLTDLHLEDVQGGDYTAGVLELVFEQMLLSRKWLTPASKLKRLTFHSCKHYDEFLATVLGILWLEYLEINAPHEYVHVSDTKIKQVVLTREVFNGRFKIKTVLKRSKEDENEWSTVSKIKAKIACLLTNHKNKRFKGFVDKSVAYVFYMGIMRKLYDRKYANYAEW